MVYEGIGYMISTENKNQSNYINALMKQTSHENIINQNNLNHQILMQPETIKDVDYLIKVN